VERSKRKNKIDIPLSGNSPKNLRICFDWNLISLQEFCLIKMKISPFKNHNEILLRQPHTSSGKLISGKKSGVCKAAKGICNNTDRWNLKGSVLIDLNSSGYCRTFSS